MDSTIGFPNTYPLDSDYPVDSAIQRLNNQDQVDSALQLLSYQDLKFSSVFGRGYTRKRSYLKFPSSYEVYLLSWKAKGTCDHKSTI